MNIFKFLGAVGLLLISTGIISSKRRTQNIFYIIGGLCLEIYSWYLGDPIFITLQMIFILSAVYSLMKIKKRSI